MSISENNDALHILVVDDEKANQFLIQKTLGLHGLESTCVSSGIEALQKIRDESYDVILLDVMMPEIDGFEVCRRIKDDESTRLTPVIIVTALNEKEDKIKGIEAGCDDFLSKPLDRSELIARVRALGKVKRLNDDLEKAESIVMSLARAVEAKDDATGKHCDRLISLSKEFGQFMELSEPDIKTLERVSVLHDVGKIGMPDSILLKPGILTPEEWEIMRKHPKIGENICTPLRSLKSICPIIRTHHERWNGTGYPDGLSSEDIPYLSRVFQMLDAYDALTTERTYKRAYPHYETIKILEKETNEGMWDPNLMKQFTTFLATKDKT